MRSHLSGVRTTRRIDGYPLPARNLAVAPFAAIMKPAMMSLARFLPSALSSLIAVAGEGEHRVSGLQGERPLSLS